MRARPKPPTPPEPSARERLLAGALQVFSRLGFEAATTRAIAEASGVNLASIPYYFGTKEALYREVVAAICASITTRMAPRIAAAQATLRGPDPDAASLQRALCDMVDAHVGIVLSEDMVQAAPILAREQASPSPVFEVVYREVLGPQLDLAAALVARLHHLPPAAPEARVKAYALLGMGVHIAYARQSFRLFAGDDLEGTPGQAQVRQWIRELVHRALTQAEDFQPNHRSTRKER